MPHPSRRVPAGPCATFVACLALALLGAPWLAGCDGLNTVLPWNSEDPELAVTGRPLQVPGEGYVSSKACQACHPGPYASWHDSYHRRMTQVADEETVVAPFDGRELAWRGASYRVLERDGRALVEVPDPAGEGAPLEHEVVMTTGSHHFQAYWYPQGTGRRLLLFPFCWRIDEGRWMPIDAAFLFPPELTQTSDSARWNTTCNKCHATHAEPRLFGETTMDTRAAEFGIACEACHGPGEEHVRVNRDPLRRYRQHGARGGNGGDPTIVQPERLPPRERAMVCGQCHGITVPQGRAGQNEWALEGFSFVPGEDLDDSRDFVHEGETYFWDDGVPRVSGREYMGLVRSPCYVHGSEERGTMTCLSCHELHQEPDDPRPRAEWTDDQLAPGMRGDEGCLQCHGELRAPERMREHTHHEPGSAGSACYDCHMTYTTWGLLKAIRTHEVRSPDVRETLEAGRPNACNLCHLDRSLEWTAEHLEEWYGSEAPDVPAERAAVAEGVRGLLAGDAGERALYAFAFGREEAREASGRDWMAPFLAELLLDPYHAVRFRAYRSLATLPGLEHLAYDFVGPPAQREVARERALSAWISGGPLPPGETRAATLIDGEGRLMRQVFERLRAQRDDRPVMLEE